MTSQQVLSYTVDALFITFAMMVVRSIWVYAKAGISYLKLLKTPHSKSFSHTDAAIISWSGMRGIVSLAAALALPYTHFDGSAIEGRNVIIFMTYAVIMATLLIPGLTLPLLLHWLKIKKHSDQFELQRIRKHLAETTDEILQNFLQAGKIDKSVFVFLQTYFASHHTILEISHSADNRVQAIELVRKEVIQAQRKHLIEMWKQKQIDDIILTHLEQELDIFEVHIARGELK